jgi:hypothetical protein
MANTDWGTCLNTGKHTLCGAEPSLTLESSFPTPRFRRNATAFGVGAVWASD